MSFDTVDWMTRDQRALNAPKKHITSYKVQTINYKTKFALRKWFMLDISRTWTLSITVHWKKQNKETVRVGIVLNKHVVDHERRLATDRESCRWTEHPLWLTMTPVAVKQAALRQAKALRLDPCSGFKCRLKRRWRCWKNKKSYFSSERRIDRIACVVDLILELQRWN